LKRGRGSERVETSWDDKECIHAHGKRKGTWEEGKGGVFKERGRPLTPVASFPKNRGSRNAWREQKKEGLT